MGVSAVSDLPPFEPLSSSPPTDRSWGINFGGGTNSTALVLECYRRELRPDYIVFADTGSERDETYASIERLQAWLKARDFTPLSITRWVRQKPLEDGRHFESLEEHCLRTSYLPSAAYGYAGCSSKFKRQPAEKWRKENGFYPSVYALGYDSGEHRRVNRRRCEERDAVGEEPWYPLYAWGVSRAMCVDIISAAGLPPVPKSACFFCPHQKPAEWLDLRKNRPDLFDRAMAIESRARAAGNADDVGLPRTYAGMPRPAFLGDADAWLDVAVSRQAQKTVVGPAPDASCSTSEPTCDCFEASEP
jgi:hypothetical protein